MSEWNLDIKKPAFFTTDNDRNLVKAINIYKLWTRILCFAHCFQLTIKLGLKNFENYEKLR